MNKSSLPLSSDSLAWQSVSNTLNEVARGWNQGVAVDAASAEAGAQACIAIERLADAADELIDLQHHLRQEMNNIRAVLNLPDLPEKARRELQATLIRFARLV